MSAEEEDFQALLYPPHVQKNAADLQNMKFLSASFVGAAVGVLGLENLSGFLLYFASILISSAFIWLIQCGGRSPKRYIPGGAWSLINPGQENMFSFVLFWTLFYGEGAIYLYALHSVLPWNFVVARYSSGACL